MNEIILDKKEIISRAKLNWDNKNEANRVRAGSKYNHFLDKLKCKMVDWTSNFDSLTKQQQNLITKGELIRTYDALPNLDKTNIMHKFGLSSFSSKWYRLSGKDKKILLNYILK